MELFLDEAHDILEGLDDDDKKVQYQLCAFIIASYMYCKIQASFVFPIKHCAVGLKCGVVMV